MATMSYGVGESGMAFYWDIYIGYPGSCLDNTASLVYWSGHSSIRRVDGAK